MKDLARISKEFENLVEAVEGNQGGEMQKE